jgi:HEPN domain-containing protein
MQRHDPVRVADTRAWFAKAANDLRGADVDLAADPPLLGDALFHCQQAVEKALSLAREVYAQVLARLPGEVRP